MAEQVRKWDGGVSFTKWVRGILYSVSYKDWTCIVGESTTSTWLQVIFTSNGKLRHGRKWLLSTHMTRSEIVQTVFKAVLTAEEHEVREHFLYRNRAVFGPHIDVEELHQICERVDIRNEK